MFDDCTLEQNPFLTVTTIPVDVLQTILEHVNFNLKFMVDRAYDMSNTRQFGPPCQTGSFDRTIIQTKHVVTQRVEHRVYC
jgi:hypothetical protein